MAKRSKWDMYENGFDPYDTLLEAVERIQRLEHAHNKMAEAFHKSERELNIALKSLNHLQQTHLHVLSRLQQLEAQVMNK